MNKIEIDEVLEAENFTSAKFKLDYLSNLLNRSKEESFEKVSKFYTDHGFKTFDGINDGAIYIAGPSLEAIIMWFIAFLRENNIPGFS